MKKLKIKTLSLTLMPALLGMLCGLVSSSAPARADSAVPVPALHFTNLKPAAGKYLNVFFVQASEALLVTNTGQQLEFSEIMMVPLRAPIPANGIVNFPAQHVPKRYVNGLTKTFTHMFVAVTEAQPNPLYLRNEDGAKRPIVDPRISADLLAKLPDASFQTVNTGFISKFALPAHTQGNVITIDALVDLVQ